MSELGGLQSHPTLVIASQRGRLRRPDDRLREAIQFFMVRRSQQRGYARLPMHSSDVSNHEAEMDRGIVASSFETHRYAVLLRMRIEFRTGLLRRCRSSQ
ncbi:MAG: hypothetical protein BGO65_05040 [Afipia sp. 64-13]|nr:MAG: hypothetical protein BGO65_05040 [Afipia sp. 64-13]